MQPLGQLAGARAQLPHTSGAVPARPSTHLCIFWLVRCAAPAECRRAARPGPPRCAATSLMRAPITAWAGSALSSRTNTNSRPPAAAYGSMGAGSHEARSRLQAADHAGAAAVRSGCTVGVSWRRLGAATAAPVQGPGCRARRRGRQRAVGPCMIWRQGMLPVRRLSAAHPNATPTNHTRG